MTADGTVPDAPGAALEVLATGELATLQDLGRPGYADVGLSRSGAADRVSYRLGNRLLHNDECAASIEVTMGGLEIRAAGPDVVVAVTGAPLHVHVDDEPVSMYAPVDVPDGSIVRLGRPQHGLRSYLAVRGGIDVEPVLGSRSTDALTGVGPPALVPGTRLPIGADLVLEASYGYDPVVAPGSGPVVLHAVRGPRADRLVDVDDLVARSWTATDRSNRVGLWLDGDSVERVDPDHKQPAEATTRGAIQIGPSGQPLVFLADHPATGGYPVVGVVLDSDVDRAAQVRPGQEVRFRWSVRRTLPT